MKNEMIQVEGIPHLPAGQSEMITEQTKEYINQASAANTKKAYQYDWKHFCQWCTDQGRGPLPATPETVGDYLTYLVEIEKRKASTLQRRLSAISQFHQVSNYESPTKSLYVRKAFAGIRRAIGTAHKGKAPVLIEDIRLMVDTLPDTLLGVRDRALLLVGFAGAFRRSELVSLNVEDIEMTVEGLVIHLRRSKTDQEGQGRKIGIPYGGNPDTCPIRSLQKWIELAGIQSGPLFRSITRHGKINGRLSDKAVALVVKRTAKAAGFDPSKYAGHSLRAGLATSSAAAGKSERAIMKQTGHRSVNMVRRYIREADIFKDNAAAGIGL